MLIDPFTTIAQIINFLVLVALLKHFLYKPITKAMEQREQRIAYCLEEAAEQVTQAQQEAELYRQKQQELENQKEAWLSQAKQEVEQEKQQLREQARIEVEMERSLAREALQQKKQQLLQDLRYKMGQQVILATRRVLKSLANSDLEKQMVKKFIDRLNHLDEEQLQAIRSTSMSYRQPTVTIRSTFPLGTQECDLLIETIKTQLDDHTEVKFETATNSICGIEIGNGGYKIVWNLEHYLQQLEAELKLALATKNSVQSL
jgi:F-type H+-transporting ATPase subunit b